MKATEPKINQECQKCLVPMHQAQVRVGQLTMHYMSARAHHYYDNSFHY